MSHPDFRVEKGRVAYSVWNQGDHLILNISEKDRYGWKTIRKIIIPRWGSRRRS